MEKDSKILAAVGSLLILISPVPAVSWVSIVGVVLFLISMHNLSKEKNDKGLFSESLWAFLVPTIAGTILAILMSVAAFIFLGAAFLETGHMLDMGGMGDVLRGFPIFGALSGMGIIGIIMGVVALIGGYVVMVFYGQKMQKVSLMLDNHLGGGYFKTASGLFFWGGWLSLVFGVGLVLMWVAWLFYTIAFFSLPEK